PAIRPPPRLSDSLFSRGRSDPRRALRSGGAGGGRRGGFVARCRPQVAPRLFTACGRCGRGESYHRWCFAVKREDRMQGLPKSYRTMEEFEREEIRPSFRIGFSIDDLEETSFEAELALGAEQGEFELGSYETTDDE